MHKARRILLAEDDPRDADLALRALDRVELRDRVDVVTDGAEALDYLFRRGVYADRDSGVPMLALLDIKMPRVEGTEVLRQVRADPDLRNMPIVMLTSSRQASDVGRSYELGSNAYVVKPVDYGEFVDAIQKLSSFWVDLNEPPP